MHKRNLKTFQKEFVRAVENPAFNTCCLSIPRGNGKTTLSGYLLSRCLTPKDRLCQPGQEYILVASSLEQARLCFRVVREILEPKGGYRWTDSTQRIGAVHLATNTRLRVISSSAKHSFGIVGVPLIVLDEPGSLEVVSGTMLSDSLFTAQGKPDSNLKLVLIGTLAPADRGWWHDLVADGTHGSVYVQSLQGDPERWDSWPEIRRVNPLMGSFASSRKTLLSERDAARSDSRLKARFQSYRLNTPSADESDVLLTTDDWDRMIARPVPGRDGRPIVAVDLGGGRAWSAAAAIFENGRIECLAVAPGIPGIAEQEKRDRVPAGTYARLVDAGRLQIAEGLRVQPPAAMWSAIKSKWGLPVLIICDRFRLGELQDAVGNSVRVEPRVSRWSEAASDIRALRKHVNDGPFTVEADSRPLMVTSLTAAVVKSDDQGNTRLSKKGTNNEARDDVAAALVLGAGAYSRMAGQRPRKLRYALAG